MDSANNTLKNFGWVPLPNASHCNKQVNILIL